MTDAEMTDAETTDAEVVARATRHAALGEATRLRIVDLLAAGDRSPGELVAALEVPSNLLDHHLGVLETAGLIARARSEGDRRRSYVRLDPGAVRLARPMRPRVASRVLFVCTGNSSRSPLAAALWRRASTVPATSAGTHPADRVSAGAVTAGARHRLDLAGHTPVAVDDVAGSGDLVVAVCDRAYEELGGRAPLHWSVPNPAAVGTTAAYEETVGDLARRVDALAGLLAA